MLAHNKSIDLHVGDELIKISSGDELNCALQNLLKMTNSTALFAKPVKGVGGRNSFKIDKEKLNIANFHTDILPLIHDTEYVFQELISQHETISNIYPESVNTLRVHTYHCKSNDKYIITSAIMRFGRSGSAVDNGSEGGLFCSVDTSRWVIKGNGLSYLKKGGFSYEIHPDTNVKFDGTFIPFGGEIEALVFDAAKNFNSDFIGWDVAISPDGPLIIEGNDCPHLVMAQIACGGFRGHSIYNDIFSKHIG